MSFVPGTGGTTHHAPSFLELLLLLHHLMALVHHLLLEHLTLNVPTPF